MNGENMIKKHQFLMTNKTVEEAWPSRCYSTTALIILTNSRAGWSGWEFVQYLEEHIRDGE